MSNRVRQAVLAALMSRYEDAQDDDEIDPEMTVAQLATATGYSSATITLALQALRRDGRAAYSLAMRDWVFVPKEAPHA